MKKTLPKSLSLEYIHCLKVWQLIYMCYSISVAHSNFYWLTRLYRWYWGVPLKYFTYPSKKEPAHILDAIAFQPFQLDVQLSEDWVEWTGSNYDVKYPCVGFPPTFWGNFSCFRKGSIKVLFILTHLHRMRGEYPNGLLKSTGRFQILLILLFILLR